MAVLTTSVTASAILKAEEEYWSALTESFTRRLQATLDDAFIAAFKDKCMEYYEDITPETYEVL